MLKFSVIVPVYNVDKYLGKCIASLLEQTYQDFEIILVDDGSQDNSSAMCDAFAAQDPRIKVIHHAANGGATSARKTGANAASGAYIACVDADDWVENTYLEHFSNVLKKYPVDMVCFEYYTTDGIEHTRREFQFEEGLYQRPDIESKIFPSLIETVNCRCFPSTACAKAIRRDLFVQQQNAVDDRIRLGEDGAVIKPCIYHASSIYILKQPLYYYYFNPFSTTRSRKSFNLQEPRLRGEHIEKQLDMCISDFQAQVYRMVVHALFNVTESQFNRKEKYRVIAKNIKESLKDAYYRKAIKNCRFKCKEGSFALFSLKYKMVLLIKLFHSFKNRT